MVPFAANPARYHSLAYGLAAALTGPAAFVLFGAIGMSFFGYLPLIGFWAVAAFAATCIAVVLAFARAWRLMIAWAMLPATFAIVLLYADPLWRLFTEAGEYLHFFVMRGGYRAQIAAMSADTGARLAVFTLLEDGFGGMNDWHLVVYDESDEIALPAASRSAAWRVRSAGTVLDYGRSDASPLGDHFYMVHVSDH